MRRNAVLAASALLAASLSAPALAGDRALVDFIGFSGDGRYFAFEEFGVQDGSGFPFSTIYVIDLPADKWVAGSPFSAKLEDDGSPVDKVRQQSRALAAGVLEDLAVNEPADLIALNGDGQSGGKSIAFGFPGYGLNAPQQMRTLVLETFAADTPGTPCSDYTADPTLGFALTLDGVELHRDTTLPKSRGCALDYRIFGVVEPAQLGGSVPGAVAIISVYPFGFEGPDRRFIAVPLNQP